ncbi:lipopolysaccharide biosynthesis protein [Cupriavidus agavae]|uniref:O-antigen/teichoic acid export membrane protein n=1 Tax=Cupriavidus agavae TaxID=1001822 RepID=A0A4V2FI28_9BURK|nr:polysaccharide biosynthesis protein [Cupriavidus agavae]RZT42329.1 O-antigen/teichoic acid export membrane protein [Cupriavidus agavae]
MLIRLALRAVALAAKFALTLAIARVLGGAAMAEYGLALAAAVIGTKLLGLGYSAEMNRRLASGPGPAVREAIRLQRIYGMAYAVVCLAILALVPAGWLPASAAVVLALLVVSEHQAYEVNSYLFALHRTRAASWLLFVRTGLWAVAAMAGLAAGVVTSMVEVLGLWVAANLGVIAHGWWVIAREADAAPPVRAREAALPLAVIWRAGASFYLAAVLLSGTQYAERFIASAWLDAVAVGQYVFLWAIANAVQTLAQAGLVATAGPALARTASQAPGRFAGLLARQSVSLLATTVVMAVGLFLLLDPVLALANGHASAADRIVFAVLLGSFVLRALADLLWVSAIALELRGFLLCGFLPVVLAGVPVSWLLIAGHGMLGAASAHLVLSAAVLAWLAIAIAWRLRCPAAPDSECATA